MSVEAIRCDPAARPLSARRVTFVLLALACGGLGIGTGEFAIMGLLPELAKTFGISRATAYRYLGVQARA